MPMFMCLLNWTDQGIRSIKDAPKRAKAAQDLAKKVGVEIKQVYLTSGEVSMRVTNAIARVLAACAGLFAAAALAQSPGYPDRPVKIIVPFAAAGPTDVVARLIALKLSEKYGQQFYIENMAGAGGNLGLE